MGQPFVGPCSINGKIIGLPPDNGYRETALVAAVVVVGPDKLKG